MPPRTVHCMPESLQGLLWAHGAFQTASILLHSMYTVLGVLRVILAL